MSDSDQSMSVDFAAPTPDFAVIRLWACIRNIEPSYQGETMRRPFADGEIMPHPFAVGSTVEVVSETEDTSWSQNRVADKLSGEVADAIMLAIRDGLSERAIAAVLIRKADEVLGSSIDWK